MIWWIVMICAVIYLAWSIKKLGSSPLPPSMMPDIEDLNHGEDKKFIKNP